MNNDNVELVKAVDVDDTDMKNTTYLQRQTLNQNVKDNFCLYAFLLCLLGLINNTGIVMITTIAHDLSADFDKKQLMPLFQFFENVFSVYVWFASSRYFIKVKHINRLIFNSLVMMLSYGLLGILIIYKFKFGFYLSLF